MFLKNLSCSSFGTFLYGIGQGDIFVETVCDGKVNWEFCFDLGAPDVVTSSLWLPLNSATTFLSVALFSWEREIVKTNVFLPCVGGSRG